VTATECLRRLLSYAKPYRFRLVLGVAAGFLAGASNALMLGSIKVVVDTIFPLEKAGAETGIPTWLPEFANGAARWLIEQQALVRENPKVWATIVIIALVPLSMFIRGLFTYLNAYLSRWVAVRTLMDIRTGLFAHLLSLPASFFNRMSTGELMAKLEQTGQMGAIVSRAAVTLIREPITILTVTAFLLSVMEPKLILIALCTLPFAMGPFIIYARKLRQASKGAINQMVQLGRIQHESMTGYRVLKAYNLETRVTREFRDTAKSAIGFLMKNCRASELPGPIMEFMAGLGISIFLIYMAFLSPQTTAGDLTVFAGGIFSMYKPIKDLFRLRSELYQMSAAGEVVFGLLDTQSDIAEPVAPKPLDAAGAPIHFDQVEFAYGERGAIHGVNLTVPPGKVVALVGASGSGKTTLTNLLLRFYDPQSGHIRIGETDIRDVLSTELRSQIAVVTQEVILFNDTIRNNILMGREGASDDEMIAAAKHAHAHEFILEKPEGYDTVIGERGAQLSGGQRQRVAIARAILRNAPILILDEATSALDTESERIVQAALDELMKGRTTICIAHRLSTIQKADRIVVLSEGRIVEHGTHSELLAKGGTYKHLYDLQFRDEG
jgi:subfamily B ATP-binding cassette protein MsbA